MEKRVLTDNQIELARVAKALSHPVRIAILQFLASEQCCYHGDMSELLPIAKSTLSQHLKELKDAELIQGITESPNIRYCINQEGWSSAKKLIHSFIDEI